MRDNLRDVLCILLAILSIVSMTIFVITSDLYYGVSTIINYILYQDNRDI